MKRAHDGASPSSRGKKKRKKSKSRIDMISEFSQSADGDSIQASNPESPRVKLNKKQKERERKKEKMKAKKKRKKLEKAEKEEREKEQPTLLESVEKGRIDDGYEISYPYTVNGDDHCESPFEAYQDIDPVLSELATRLGKDKATLSIYDPYYCEGSMIKRLNQLGYHTIYNKKEDFYDTIATNRIPEYDVLVTNPPYSDEHVPKLLTFALQSRKPYFLLMPNWVYMKDYYSARNEHSQMHYISPLQRYNYTTPKGRRQQKSSKYTSPFPSFWYFSTSPSLSSSAVQHIYTDAKIKEEETTQELDTRTKAVYSKTIDQLPLSVCCDRDPRKRKERDREKRKKHKKRKKGEKETG